MDCFALIILYLWVESQVCEEGTSQIFCQTVKNPHPPLRCLSVLPRPPTQSDPSDRAPSACCFVNVCVCVCLCAYIFGMVLEDSGGASVGADYPPPLPSLKCCQWNELHRAVPNALVSLLYFFTPLLSAGQNTTTPLLLLSCHPPHHSSNQRATCRGHVWHRDWRV